MSKIHAHITTISHRSSTVCGRRRHSAASATDAQRPDADDDADHRRRVAVALHDRGSDCWPAVARYASRAYGDAKRRTTPRELLQYGCDAPMGWRSRLARGARRRSRTAGSRHARTCTATPCSAGRRRAGRWREKTGKGQRVRDADEGGEEVAAGEHQQSARELRKPNWPNSRTAVIRSLIDERGLIDRNECPDRRERHLGERHRREEDRRRHCRRRPARFDARADPAGASTGISTLVRQLLRPCRVSVCVARPTGRGCRVREARASRQPARAREIVALRLAAAVGLEERDLLERFPRPRRSRRASAPGQPR